MSARALTSAPRSRRRRAGVEEAVFGGDVEEGRATQGEQAAAGRAAIELGVAAVEERRIGVEEGGEFVGAAAEERQDAGNVVARAGSGGQEDLDAGGEALGVARVSLDDVVEGGAGIFGVAAVGVGAVIEEPLERFRFEILARSEENGEPAPAQPVDVGAVTDQKLHHRNAAGLRDTLEGHVVDQYLAESGVGGEEFVDAREVIRGRLPGLSWPACFEPTRHAA